MVFDFILGLLQLITFAILAYIISFKIIHPYLEKRNRNIEYELYANLDIAAIETEIDKMIETYLNKYVLMNITANEKDFLRREDIELMTQSLTKDIVKDLSSLYLFYIKCIININDQDDIVKFIYRRVQWHVIEFSTNFNKER